MNIRQALDNGTFFLKKNQIKLPQLESEILMSYTLKKKRSEIIINSDENLSIKVLSNFNNLIVKRSKGTPIAYLINKKSFWDHDFFISRGVLIPRPDTELIVEQILKLTSKKDKLNILDIGVGSGCIILSLLKEKEEFKGVGIDISQKCLQISKINAHNLGLKSRVKFFKSDIDNFNYGKYDLIVSNPPYIRKNDLNYLEKDIIGFEPKKALNGGIDGLSEIRKVVKKSSELVKINGKLVLEIAFDQKEKVIKILKKNGFYINKVIKDLAKNDRCIISTKI